MRHVLAFFALGALLFGGKRYLEPRTSELPELVVHVAVRATESEIERAIDEAVLMHEALAHGGALIDPVVRDQLLRSMRVTARGDEGEDALLDRALALGVHRADPVVRQRLAFQAQQLLRARARVPTPSDDALARYLTAHTDRYRLPARVSFDQVFLSRAKRGDRVDIDAAELRARLARGEVPPARSHEVSDPSLHALHADDLTLSELDARYGPGFGEQVWSRPSNTWSAPIASAYGLHLVNVRARTEARVPALSEVRSRVVRDYVHDETERVLQGELSALRARYRIDVRRSAS